MESQNVVQATAAFGERFAFHPLSTQITEQDGFVVQTLTMKGSKGEASAVPSVRIRVPELSVVAALEHSAIAEELQDALYALRAQYVLRPQYLNGASSVALEDCSLEALNAALIAGGQFKLTKELMGKLFAEAITLAIASLVAEAKGLPESLPAEDVLKLAAPTLTLFRGEFFKLCARTDAVSIDATIAGKMRKVVERCKELLPQSGAGSATQMLELIDARAVQADAMAF